MRKLFMTFLVLPLSLLGLLHAMAIADNSTVVTSAALPQTVSVWAGLAITLLAAGSWALRAFTADTNFAHTKLGAAVIAFGCALLTGVVEVARTKGFHVETIVPCIGGAVASTLAMMNPTMTSQNRATQAPEAAQPTPSKEAGYIPFGVMLTLVATGVLLLLFGAGCGPASKAYGIAYGACMSGKGLEVAGTVPDKVNAVLTSSDSRAAAVSALEGIGIGAATDAVTCAVKAWLVVNQLPKNASPSPRLVIGRAAAEEYLERHDVPARGGAYRERNLANAPINSHTLAIVDDDEDDPHHTTFETH